MIDQFITFSLIAVNTLINILFLKCFFPKERYSNKDILYICLLIIEGIIVSISLRAFIIAKLILNLLAGIIVTIFIFHVSWKRSIIYNLFFFGLSASVEIVVLLVFQYVFSVNNYSELNNENGAAIMEIICYLFMLLIIVIINLVHNKNMVARLDTKGWIAFVMYPVITLGVISLLINIPQDQISQKVFRIVFAFAVCMLFLSIMQFYLLENIMQREAEIYRKQALIDQAEHVNQMYRSLSEEREIQKARAHDFLNHLNALLVLAEQNKSAEEIRYLKEQIGLESDSVDIIDTGDAVINAVLNIKFREAKKKGITMPLMIDDLSNLRINESDIVTILSNILDNAIDAAEQCDIKKIVLQISKNEQERKLFIDSSNTCLVDSYNDKHRYTTKTDKDNHGYGIMNIKYAVEKNNGECIIDTKDGIFRIIITIPL